MSLEVVECCIIVAEFFSVSTLMLMRFTGAVFADIEEVTEVDSMI